MFVCTFSCILHWKLLESFPQNFQVMDNPESYTWYWNSWNLFSCGSAFFNQLLCDCCLLKINDTIYFLHLLLDYMEERLGTLPQGATRKLGVKREDPKEDLQMVHCFCTCRGMHYWEVSWSEQYHGAWNCLSSRILCFLWACFVY